jgi:predicted acyl esterase
MRILTEFPRRVRQIMTEWIPMPDGVRLAARIWLPEDALLDPVPAVLEYLPYRRRDGTAWRDSITQPYLAGHGYAAVRVDIRGSGDSEGLLLDEYDLPEMSDGVTVVEWLARQSWCSGKVGMWGISWGGFNALQVAALAPPALKAILPIGFTHDRYNGDCHYMGGCLLEGNVSWGGTLFAGTARPPDPDVVGPGWREQWLGRLRSIQPPLETWLRHQRRDDYWKPGSVCEDYARIKAAVYAVSGWQDSYSRNVLALLEGLCAPKKALIGPWAHGWPHLARPGPAIGFLQEALRWWDHWLKGVDNGIMDEPMLRVWMQDWMAPARAVDRWPGRWVAEPIWPKALAPQLVLSLANPSSLPLSPGEGRGESWRLVKVLEPAAPHPSPLPRGARERDPRSQPSELIGAAIASPQTVGVSAGYQCSYGLGPDLSDDQRADDALSLCFDTEPLLAPLEILGETQLEIDVASNRAQALLAVRLCDVAPDGSSLRVSYGLLNLAQREGAGAPLPLLPGQPYKLPIALCAIAHAFPAGHRVRIALSTSYWPIAWPSPEAATLTLLSGRLLLPERAPNPMQDETLQAFGEPQGAAPQALVETRARGTARALDRIEEHADGASGVRRVELVRERDRGAWRTTDSNVAYDTRGELRFSIDASDPLSARQQIAMTTEIGRPGWQVRTEAGISLSCTHDSFCLEATLQAFDGEEQVFSGAWSSSVKRDHL